MTASFRCARMALRSTVFALPVALATFSCARAEWLLVSQDDLSTIYMDPKSKKMSANGVVEVDALTDYDPNSAKAGAFGLSQKGLSEVERVLVDCVNRKYISGGGSWFERQMGRGEVRSHYSPGSIWSDIPEFYMGLFARTCS